MNHPISEVTRRYLSSYGQIVNRLAAGMGNAPQNGSISHNFIMQMLPHHRAAVEMSQNVLKYVHSPKVRAMAQRIIDRQTQEIKQLENALDTCAQLQNSPEEAARYQVKTDEIMHKMLQKMRNALKTNKIAEDFMLEMLPHHEGAIEMSRNALSYPICEQLTPLLEQMIASQEQEMLEMKHFLELDRD